MKKITDWMKTPVGLIVTIVVVAVAVVALVTRVPKVGAIVTGAAVGQ